MQVTRTSDAYAILYPTKSAKPAHNVEMNLAGKLIVAGTEIEDFAKAEIRV